MMHTRLPALGWLLLPALPPVESDAHILYHAGMIRMSVGDLIGGRAALRQAVEINPRHATFHVHR